MKEHTGKGLREKSARGRKLKKEKTRKYDGRSYAMRRLGLKKSMMPIK